MLLRDILRGEDPQVKAVAHVVARISPDILVLQRVDYDLHLHAAKALRDMIAQDGPTYPHVFAFQPNSGVRTGLDMDGNGRIAEPRDTQGYGDFVGQRGMVVMSRFPIIESAATDFSAFLWRDLPQALLPEVNGAPFPSAEAQSIQRLSSVGHWVLPIQLADRKLDLMVFHATAPVFDGPEDLNGRRNHDELIFWSHYLDGYFAAAPDGAFVLAGAANLDPLDSDGRGEAITALLTDLRFQDPRPMRPGTPPSDPGHRGDPRLDTVEWPAPGPGALRVDYILPSSDLHVVDAGVFCPLDGTPDAEMVQTASRHRMVWIDVRIDDQ